MTNPIDLTGAVPRYASGEEPQADTPIQERVEQAAAASIGERSKHAAEPFDPPDYGPPVNPYAPTGWKQKQRVEFDMRTPTGQMCRVMRLEREDLFRMNLMQYLDTFTPMLMDQAASSEEGRDKKIQATLKDNPDALGNMFMAIDEVVMAATVKPKVTNDEQLRDYGSPKDWTNPRFVATAYIGDIAMEDRMAIFAAAFGKSMDDLKSVWPEETGVGSVADVTGVQQAAE